MSEKSVFGPGTYPIREEPALTTVARLLKERTAEMHTCVEAGLDLTDPALDLVRLRDVVVGLRGFWSGTEPKLDAWAAEHPDEAATLKWSRRRRLDRLTRDVARLGGTAGAIAPAVVEEIDIAAVLGWLYVAEGSTLGGAVISRALLRIDRGLRLESFAPYDEGPGPMWRELGEQLGRWTDSDEVLTERVVAAGVATFAALATWTSPLARRAVA